MMTYQICKKCIMDTSDPDIRFNENKICNYCTELDNRYQSYFSRTPQMIETILDSASKKIKKSAGQSKYHCVLGLSGGVDSSFTADLIVNKMHLNPLIIHFDNGWNSPLAVENINKIITKLNLDMLTYVIDWDEFKDLQRAFLHSSVLDIEMLTDNAIYGALIKLAKKYKIKCIVSGENFATESGLPQAWRWEKLDAKNIKSIHHRFGTRKLKSFPIYGPKQFILDRALANIYYFYPLNIIQYNQKSAIEQIKNKYQWQYYGGKHYESIFTRFYQTYILPIKFGVDKRRAHLSSLIRNKEITRENALNAISKNLYESDELQKDIDYILKKLDLSQNEFNIFMSESPKNHADYPSDLKMLTLIKKIANKLKLNKNNFI